MFARLEVARPRDVNINAAVSDEGGTVTFYDHEDGGLGTIERRTADRHRSEHGVNTSEITVVTTTLSAVFEEHAPRDMHFLKVDVEGHEAAVLRSLDWRRYRPWILCIEATEPMHVEIKTFQQWDGLLTEAGYILARSDWLNRYYVAAERSHLIGRFAEEPRGYVRG